MHTRDTSKGIYQQVWLVVTIIKIKYTFISEESGYEVMEVIRKIIPEAAYSATNILKLSDSTYLKYFKIIRT